MMPAEFEIENGVLLKYHGARADVTVPEGVTQIGKDAFHDCWTLRSVFIPDGVTQIGAGAFENSTVTSIRLPEDLIKIGAYAFHRCSHLTSVVVPQGVREIESNTFGFCSALVSVVIPNGVTKIGRDAFYFCEKLSSFPIPEGLTEIGEQAFYCCRSLTEAVFPENLRQIGSKAFRSCTGLTRTIIPGSVTQIGEDAFVNCANLTIICPEGSCIHRYCEENRLNFIFDFQFEAFHGVLPQGFEKLAAPFAADEEKPYIFISYSHMDRDAVLHVIRPLYESGWKIWYDEGLTIGDSYDETLEVHVKNCCAFLLFVSENLLGSRYVRENEVPWALAAGKPIIKCLLEKGIDYEIAEGAVLASVSVSDIEPALEKVSGLVRGEKRAARGISVVVDPAVRDGAEGGGIAYCLYAGENAATAKAIMLEARNSGCVLYDEAESGIDEERLSSSPCLIVFLDRAFLSDARLVSILTEAFNTGRDMAVCQIGEIVEEDLPQELKGLELIQWLNYAHGITGDLNTNLARHLQKRGCRNAAVLPGFEYEKTEDGIIIKRYAGLEPAPWIAEQYGGVPVTEIADGAFKNRIHLRSISIPDSVKKIGKNAFEGCTDLTSIVLPKHLTKIEEYTFAGCLSLPSVTIPESVTEIGDNAFERCEGLKTVVIPDSVTAMGIELFQFCRGLTTAVIGSGITEIRWWTFRHCESLTSVTLPEGVGSIGPGAFNGCAGLTEIVLPESVREIERVAFAGCRSLVSVTIPRGVTIIDNSVFRGCESLHAIDLPEGVSTIEDNAFQNCTGLTSVTIPESVKKIGKYVFDHCPDLTVTTPKKSFAWEYCRKTGIPVRAARRGLLGWLFPGERG